MSLRGGAARRAGRCVRRSTHGDARIVAATGASQFEFLEALTAAPGIDWTRVEMFHLDEYVGLPIDHPASFRRYLLERLIGKTGMTRVPPARRRARRRCASPTRSARELGSAPIDVAFVGIGENGHLAFNDPPADFDDRPPVPDRHARRGVPAAAGRRGLVRVGRRRAVAGDLDVGAPDSEVARDHLRRARRAEGAGGQGVPRRRRCRRWRPRRFCRRTPNTTVYLDRDSAALLTPGDARRRSSTDDAS